MIDVVDNDGQTPLNLAVKKGYFFFENFEWSRSEVFIFVLELINSKCAVFLYIFFFVGRERVVKYLLKKVPKEQTITNLIEIEEPKAVGKFLDHLK